jgi:hypothetical protein
LFAIIFARTGNARSVVQVRIGAFVGQKHPQTHKNCIEMIFFHADPGAHSGVPLPRIFCMQNTVLRPKTPEIYAQTHRIYRKMIFFHAAPWFFV